MLGPLKCLPRTRPAVGERWSPLSPMRPPSSRGVRDFASGPGLPPDASVEAGGPKGRAAGSAGARLGGGGEVAVEFRELCTDSGEAAERLTSEPAGAAKSFGKCRGGGDVATELRELQAECGE
mmetsp:Transcript_116413/g.370352  ORF Transcript_116413/g.370352 Transcript_116413/m.370352 type:complete len:123 (+) Transcript_116413:2032-2400(+)